MKVSNLNITQLQIIYGLSILNSLLFIFFIGLEVAYDSSSYIQAWEVLLNGEIDKWRTPIYPIFLGIIQSIIGEEQFYTATICMQHLIFLLSIRYFYQVAKKLCHHKIIVFIITLLYALHPGIASWNNFILTESLAVSFSVFLIYFAMKVWMGGTCKDCFLYNFWLLLLIFLRPAFVYIIPVSIVAWTIAAILKKETRKSYISCIVGVFIVTCSQLIYMNKFEERFGIFSPSGISIVNQYYIARQTGLLDSNLTDNAGLKNYINKSILENGQTCENHNELWEESNDIVKLFGLKDVQKIVTISNKSNPISYIKKVGGRIVRASYINYPPSYNKSLYSQYSTYILSINLSDIYLFLFFFFFILLYNILKQKYIPWYSSFFFMLGCSNIIVAIVGAQGEWSRLILPSIPIYLLMFGQLCNMINITTVPNSQLE